MVTVEQFAGDEVVSRDRTNSNNIFFSRIIVDSRVVVADVKNDDAKNEIIADAKNADAWWGSPC